MTEKLDRPIFRVVSLILLVTIALAGCTPTAPVGDTTEAQSEVAKPTSPPPDLDPVRTEVAQTVVAEITVEAIADASNSPASSTGDNSSEDLVETKVVPASVQSQNPTATPTLPDLDLPTETAVADSASVSPTKVVPAYNCIQKWQDPKDGYKIIPGGRFDITWTIQNTGSATWDTDKFDYMYLKGDKLHMFADRKDLAQEVKQWGVIGLFVNMEGPATPGTYRTWWSVVDGHDNPVCIVYLSIEVTN